MTKQKNNDKVIFHKFFAEFYKWNAAGFILFLVAYVSVLIWGGEWGRYWLFPVCWLILLLTAVRYYVYFFTALIDLKKSRIETKDISVQTVLLDKHLNYYNRGGVMLGNGKCRLIDSENTVYYVTSEGTDALFWPDDYYHRAEVRIEYLERSKIVLHMKNISRSAAAQHLYDNFRSYYRRISKD